MADATIQEVLAYLREQDRGRKERLDEIQSTLASVRETLHEHGVTLRSVLAEQKKTNGRVTVLEDGEVRDQISRAVSEAKTQVRAEIKERAKRSGKWWATFAIGVIASLATFTTTVILVWEALYPNVKP